MPCPTCDLPPSHAREHAARPVVRERSAGVCERCRAARATNMHHRLNRSQGGMWCPSNLLDLCGSGTTGCHGWITHHPDEATALGLVVRMGGDPAAVPVFSPLYGVDVLLDGAGCLTFA